jgi:hypothetical protein
MVFASLRGGIIIASLLTLASCQANLEEGEQFSVPGLPVVIGTPDNPNLHPIAPFLPLSQGQPFAPRELEQRTGGVIEGLLYPRQLTCPLGTGYCRNTGSCCPVGGDCCPNRNCCRAGSWCYGSGTFPDKLNGWLETDLGLECVA